MEVAVDERAAADLERRVDGSRQRHELASRAELRTVEPTRDVVADPPERRAGRTPETRAQVDGDGGRGLLGQLGEIAPRAGALEQQCPPRSVAPDEPYGAVATPQLERVRLLVGLVVVRRRHLQDGIGSGRRDERVAGQRERRAERHAPLIGDLGRDSRQAPEICAGVRRAVSRPAASRYLATSTARDSRITITFT